ncbi:DUF1800 domain-containing protein [Sphingomonas oligophenolica]|uniref:DUF1800 domain-containing protein n=1 Tax=Sphingomonas oligophenolica TaxID=301154 RepID=A0A502CM81_9SPHN|nr:DUF1800 domain-containing protein [Sphingomonas oligophenolica]
MNRFGLGARPGEAIPARPKAWLVDQFASYQPRPAALAEAPTSAAVAADLAEYQDQRRAMRQQGIAAPDPTAAPAMAGGAAKPADAGADDAMKQARRFARREARDDYGALVGARTIAALTGPAPFVERMVHFWANHFAVSADKLTVVGLAGTLEMEAIRPHVLGHFADMLNAVERHPAMLLYLDQAVSVGPDSPLGQRVTQRAAQNGMTRKVGLNENLAREILELHTLGVRTGYTQADVTEFARAMTGWTVAGIGRGPGARAAGTAGGQPGDFVFAPAIHEPGARTIMGRTYPAGGEAQAQAVLTDVAIHPATATHIATKLTRHFAGDTPPPAMVDRISAAFLASKGDLPTIYRAIIESPEAWVETPVKFKNPWEWTISSLRALGTTQVKPLVMVGLMNQLGQPVWKPGQPVGYDDIAGSWAGPDALLRRVEAAERFATRAEGTIDARTLAPQLFPASVSAATAQSLARAESPGQALALLLVAPEMMRR